MFHIKICGITNLDDARMVAQAGADAIGLNFYPKSPRYVRPETAAEIVRILPGGVAKVGLFVDTPVAEIRRLFDRLKLDWVQLHGDQSPEFLAELKDLPIMRALRMGSHGLTPVTEYLSQCRALSALPALVLLDALVEGAYGGTGKLLDWEAAKQYASLPSVPPLVLAGGLTPDNVAAAIQTVDPVAVDVASGVESTPGRKDPSAVRRFIEAARAAKS